MFWWRSLRLELSLSAYEAEEITRPPTRYGCGEGNRNPELERMRLSDPPESRRYD